jgi:hypothetical protein
MFQQAVNMFQQAIIGGGSNNTTFQQRLTDIENSITTTDSNNNIYSTLTQLQQDKNEFRTWCNNNQPTNVNTKVETLHKILRHVLITPLTPTTIMRISISMLKESLHYFNDPLAKTLMINTIFHDAELINIIIQSLNKGITSDIGVNDHITLAVETVLLIATTCKMVALSNSVERESIFTLLNNIGLLKLVGDFAFHLQEKVPVQLQEQEQASSFQIVTHCLQYIVRYLVGFAHGHQYNIQPPTKSLLILNGMMRNGLIEAYFKLPPMFRHMHEDEESTLIGEVEIYTPQESAKFVYEIVLLLNDQSINNEGEENEFSYKSIHRASIGKFIYNCVASLRDIDEWFGDVVADYEVVVVYSMMIVTLMFRGLGGEQENIDALYFAGSVMDMEGGKVLLNDILQHLRDIEGWSGEGHSDDELEEDEEDEDGHTLGAFHQNWSWATLLVDNPENTTNSTFLTGSETLPRLEACRVAWEDDHHRGEGIFKNDIKWLITSGTMTISILRECMKAGVLSQQMEGQRIKRANIVA